MEQIPINAVTIDPGILMGVLSSVSAQVYPEQNRRWVAEGTSEEATLLLSTNRESIEPEFNDLVMQWKSERTATSSTTVIAMHPAYQRIIGMGKAALPLILRELDRELDHWFWALRAISGEDPIPFEHRGKMKQMAIDWLEWGRVKGYVR